MSKCRFKACDNFVTGRQVFCSDRCRKAQSRTDNLDKPNSDTQVGQGLTRVERSQAEDFERQCMNASAVLLPTNFGQPDCQCQHCKGDKVKSGKLVLNHGPYKTHDQLAHNERNRQTLPGDAEYDSRRTRATGATN